LLPTGGRAAVLRLIGCVLRPIESTKGEKNLPRRPTAPIYGALRIQTKSVGSTRLLVERGISGTVRRRPRLVGQASRVVSLSVGLLAALICRRAFGRGVASREQGIRPAGRGRRRGLDRDIGASGAGWLATSRGTPCVQVDDVRIATPELFRSRYRSRVSTAA
jgi:hypothetical protein